MVRSRWFAPLFLSLVVTSAVGCAADAADPDAASAPDDGSDEVRSSIAGEVVAIKINGGATVAAPAKVSRILENIGLNKGAKKPKEGGYRCPPNYRLELLKANGTTAATAGFMCSGGDRTNAAGSVQVGGKSYLITAKDVDAIDAIAKEPLAVGDILFGVDKATIVKPAQQAANKTITDGASVAKLLGALSADEVPNPNASFPRCLPSRSVAFFKGATQVANVGLNCGEGARGKVQGAFSVAEPRIYGAVQIDAGVVFDIEAAAR